MYYRTDNDSISYEMDGKESVMDGDKNGTAGDRKVWMECHICGRRHMLGRMENRVQRF
jgi:hypothetical protein